MTTRHEHNAARTQVTERLVWMCPRSRCKNLCTKEYWNSKQNCCPACARTKHRATPTRIDGLFFHSKKEAQRWQELCLLEQQGEICDLARQVPFPFWEDLPETITPDRLPPSWRIRQRWDGGWSLLIGTYVADHVYRLSASPEEQIIEDVKSSHTRTIEPYPHNKRLMLVHYGMLIYEV